MDGAEAVPDGRDAHVARPADVAEPGHRERLVVEVDAPLPERGERDAAGRACVDETVSRRLSEGRRRRRVIYTKNLTYTESSHFSGFSFSSSHAFSEILRQLSSIAIRPFATESPLSAFLRNSSKSRPNTGW